MLGGTVKPQMTKCFVLKHRNKYDEDYLKVKMFKIHKISIKNNKKFYINRKIFT